MLKLKIFDPLEQFDIVNCFFTCVSWLTNYYLEVCVGTVFRYFVLRVQVFSTGRKIYGFWRSEVMVVVKFCQGIVVSQLGGVMGKAGNCYYVLRITIFLCVLLRNVIGLWPYHFTITSQLGLVLWVAAALFFGIISNGVMVYGWKWFKLFLPAGVPARMSVFLVLIELISYFSRILSLSVRLFANRLSGHALRKILARFTIALVGVGTVGTKILALLSLRVLGCIFGLECMIAVLQRYVFVLLICRYLNESLTLGGH
jgi:F-type H+-transporting ATPase subunit a